MPPNDAVKNRSDKFAQAAVNENEKSPQAVQQGRATRHPSSSSVIRRAFCKTAAQAATTITCYLDADETGEEVTVNCEIIGGAQLNDAIPLLQNGTEIKVIKMDGSWDCISPFQAVGVGLNFDGAVVKVAVDTDQFKFDGNNLQTTLAQC